MQLNTIALLKGCTLIFLFVACHKMGEPGTGVHVDGPTQVQEEAFAFPGAEGFAQKATGGRGGKVLFVTNLNDSGAGSFRAAVQAVGPRYVLFKVSGTIALKSNLDIVNGDISILGQSAPGDGICLRDYPLRIGADNVIIRFMRFRLGDVEKVEADALEGRLHKNIMIDHCSMSWSVDECLTLYANENTSLQWCIIAESMNNSVHSKGAHGYGGIWGGKHASFHHNLLANHQSRNPRLGELAGDVFALTDLTDLRNNVIYNWGGNSCYGGEAMNVNIVNCYYKPGPATPANTKERIISIDKNKDQSTPIYDIWGKFFIDGNYIVGSTRATDDNWTYGVFNQFHSSYGTVSAGEKAAIKMSAAHPINNNTTTHSAQVAYEKVLELAGASLFRDAVDTRIVGHVQNGTFTANGSAGSSNGIIDSQEDVGGWPVLNSTTPAADSSGDGMPDDWKTANKLDPALKQANGRGLSSAYDNLEVYLNGLVADIIVKQK